MPKKKDGLALMILSGGKKKPKDDADDKKALLAACGTFASSMGLKLPPEKEEAACEALLDFVHIAMDYQGNPGSDKEEY